MPIIQQWQLRTLVSKAQVPTPIIWVIQDPLLLGGYGIS
jgi:hypothetical protein